MIKNRTMSWWPSACQALDQAISRVAESEYQRLSAGRGSEECLHYTEQALEGLGGLQRGEEPEYNEWDALFYITWYHPRQVNLALALIRYFLSRRPSPPRGLHVIDLGCGSFAVRFALAIALAETRLSGASFDVAIRGIDPSRSMKEIGEKLWLEFLSIVTGTPSLSCVATACGEIASSCVSHDSSDSYCASHEAHVRETSPATDCWLIAAHTVYESNRLLIRNELATIRTKSRPALVIVTTHVSKVLLAHFAAGSGFTFTSFHEPYPWSGTLDRTTAWRTSLIYRLAPPPDHIGLNFLPSPVVWNPSSKSAAIYREGN